MSSATSGLGAGFMGRVGELLRRRRAGGADCRITADAEWREPVVWKDFFLRDSADDTRAGSGGSVLGGDRDESRLAAGGGPAQGSCGGGCPWGGRWWAEAAGGFGASVEPLLVYIRSSETTERARDAEASLIEHLTVDHGGLWLLSVAHASSRSCFLGARAGSDSASMSASAASLPAREGPWEVAEIDSMGHIHWLGKP